MLKLGVDYRSLKNAMLFKNMPDETLMELAKHCQLMELPADEMLFQQDDPGDALYLLEEGQVHIVRKYPNGEEVILDTEGPYYVIGELSMLAGQPRTGGVLAVSDCTLIALKHEAFMDVCRRIPGLASAVMTYLATRLYRMNLMVRENAIGNMAARIASVLLLLSGGKAGEVPTDVRVNRIARAAAVNADTVERMLQDWTKAGYITFDGRRLTIHNSEVLQNMSG